LPRARGAQVATTHARHPERLQRSADARLVVRFARDREALLEARLRLEVASHVEGDLAGVEQRPAARGVAAERPGARQRFECDAMAEPQQAAIDPVELGGAREPQPELGAVSRVVAPRMRREQVLALAIEAREPHALLGPLEPGAGLLDEREEVRKVLAPCDIRLARGDEALVSVLAHRFQQAVARATGAVGRHQRLVHEVREQVHDVVAADLASRANRLDGFDRAAAAERREPAQQHAFRRREQRVAPVERGA
jgi:hypothetical protein